MTPRAELTRVTVTFTRDGIEYHVTYAHTAEPPNPGTKTRTSKATRMARRGLELALEGLGSGPVRWGGFGTDNRKSTDTIITERSMT